MSDKAICVECFWYRATSPNPIMSCERECTRPEFSIPPKMNYVTGKMDEPRAGLCHTHNSDGNCGLFTRATEKEQE